MSHLMCNSDVMVETDKAGAGQQVPSLDDNKNEKIDQSSRVMEANTEIGFLLGSVEEEAGETVPIEGGESQMPFGGTDECWVLSVTLGKVSGMPSENSASASLANASSSPHQLSRAPVTRLPDKLATESEIKSSELPKVQPSLFSDMAVIGKTKEVSYGDLVVSGEEVNVGLPSSKLAIELDFHPIRGSLAEMLRPKLTVPMDETIAPVLDTSAWQRSVPILIQPGKLEEPPVFPRVYEDVIRTSSHADHSNNALGVRAMLAEAGVVSIVQQQKSNEMHEPAFQTAFPDAQFKGEFAIPSNGSAKEQKGNVTGGASKAMPIDAQVPYDQAIKVVEGQRIHFSAKQAFSSVFADSKPEVGFTVLRSSITDRQKDNLAEQVFGGVQNGLNVSGEQATATVGRSTGNLPPEVALRTHIVHQIVRAARMHISDSSADITLRLDPPNLGIVHLNVAAERGVMTANLKVATEAVKQALEADLSMLRESLADAGIHVDAISVTVGDDLTPSWDWQAGEHANAKSHNAQPNGNHAAIPGDSEVEKFSSEMRLVTVGRFDYLA
ncbi:MAG: flagellar hook-length control protein FliK [Armatimonadota bacterium]|nr:flagellar hook-length control protein FliK [Armatimonadota bacterium]